MSKKTFDVEGYLRSLGDDLARAFGAARQATTPGQVGSAAETAVLSQLAKLLPRGVGVGSGFVIDTDGTTSRQLDVVLFESDVCPRFSVNNDPGATYYPCEGVIAVGEIKSTLTKKEVEDSFEKIASVKSLRRRFDGDRFDFNGRPAYTYRHYGQVRRPEIPRLSPNPVSGVLNDPYCDEWCEIFGFVLAGRLGTSRGKLSEHIGGLAADRHKGHCPNMILGMSGEFWAPFNLNVDRQLVPGLSMWSGTHMSGAFNTNPLGHLLRYLLLVYRNGKSTGLSVFDTYLEPKPEPIPDSPPHPM